MIAKITSGNSISGCLYYNEDKKKPKSGSNSTTDGEESTSSKLISTVNFEQIADKIPTNRHTLELAFTKWNRLNSRVKQNVFHCSLNFPNADNDKLDEKKLTDVADKFMSKMGYGNIPYAIYEHYDADHKHIHIISSRVSEKRRRVADHQEQNKAIKICRQIEEEFDLTIVDSTRKELGNSKNSKDNLKRNDVSKKNIIQSHLKFAIDESKITSFDELIDYMRTQKVDMSIRNKNGKQNIFFQFENENRMPTVFFGSQIEKYLLLSLEQKFEINNNKSIEEIHEANIKALVTELKSIEKIEHQSDLDAILSKNNLLLDISKNYQNPRNQDRIIFNSFSKKRQLINKISSNENVGKRRPEFSKTRLNFIDDIQNYLNSKFKISKELEDKLDQKFGYLELKKLLFDNGITKVNNDSLNYICNFFSSLEDFKIKIEEEKTNSNFKSRFIDYIKNNLCEQQKLNQDIVEKIDLTFGIKKLNQCLSKNNLATSITDLNNEVLVYLLENYKSISELQKQIEEVSNPLKPILAEKLSNTITQLIVKDETIEVKLLEIEQKFGIDNINKFVKNYGIGYNALRLNGQVLDYFTNNFNSYEDLVNKAKEESRLSPMEQIRFLSKGKDPLNEILSLIDKNFGIHELNKLFIENNTSLDITKLDNRIQVYLLDRFKNIDEMISETKHPFGKIPVVSYSNWTKGYRDHKDFELAKKESNINSARELVNDFYKESKLEKFKNIEHVKLISVSNSNSKNVIPQAFSERICHEMNWQDSSEDIKIAYKVPFTDSNIWQRILFKPEIKGEIVSGQKYFITDDYMTTGSTIRAYINHIEKGGGEVIGVASLVARTEIDYSVSKDWVDKIESKFGLDNFNHFVKDFGIGDDIRDLTNVELRYIDDHFSTISELREEAKKQYQYNVKELVKTVDKSIIKNFCKRDLLNEKYTLDFNFHTKNDQGILSYSDNYYQKSNRNYVQELIFEKCPFLLNEEESEEYIIRKNTIKMFENAFKKTKENCNKNSREFSLVEFVNQMKVRGLDLKLNYHRVSGKLELQKIQFNLIGSNSIRSLRVDTNETDFYHNFIKSLNRYINNVEFHSGSSAVQELFEKINAPNNTSPELIRSIQFVESLSEEEIEKNIRDISSLFDKDTINFIEKSIQNKISNYKIGQNLVQSMNSGKDNFLNRLFKDAINSNSHLITNFYSIELPERNFFFEDDRDIEFSL